MKKYAVILAGGSGQRLWPLSRRSMPKQLALVIEEKSLLQLCLERTLKMFAPENIFLVINEQYRQLAAGHLTAIPKENIIGEPVGRNTANAIGLAAGIIARLDSRAAMAVFCADHLIEPVENLQASINQAMGFVAANPKALIALAVPATSAHTGYGYIKRGKATEAENIFQIAKFKEKPDAVTAQKYYQSGKYCFNSGMFVWKPKAVMAQLKEYLPANYAILQRLAACWGSDNFYQTMQQEFPQLAKISIDYAVMEKAADVFMCPLDCNWQDIGSFVALAEHSAIADDNANLIAPATLWHSRQCKGNIIISNDSRHLIAAAGIDDLIIVHTADATLICSKAQAAELGQLLGDMQNGELEQYL